MAELLEAEGADIIRVEVGGGSTRGPSRILLSAYNLPLAVEQRGEYLCETHGYSRLGYTDDGVSVFWLLE